MEQLLKRCYWKEMILPCAIAYEEQVQMKNMTSSYLENLKNRKHISFS